MKRHKDANFHGYGNTLKKGQVVPKRPTLIHINMEPTIPVKASSSNCFFSEDNNLDAHEITLVVYLMFLYWICPQFGSNLILLVHEELTYFPRFGAFENLHGHRSPPDSLQISKSCILRWNITEYYKQECKTSLTSQFWTLVLVRVRMVRVVRVVRVIRV